MPPIVAERELAQIQRQIILAHLVIRAHDATAQQRPERFDVLSVLLAAYDGLGNEEKEPGFFGGAALASE